MTKEIRTAKANFFIELISNTRGNAKEIWTNIEKLTGNNCTNKNIRELELNGNLTHDSNESATALNIYFIDSVKNLVPNSYSQIQLTVPPNTATPVLNLSEVSQLDVVVSGLKNSKAKDAFDMDTMFLKAHKQSLTAPMTNIINKSITEGTFPNSWKSAVITPIFKSTEISNYRPINILPAVSKVAEKLVAEQLIKHLNNSP